LLIPILASGLAFLGGHGVFVTVAGFFRSTYAKCALREKFHLFRSLLLWINSNAYAI
jgi:hypothetical protein